MKRKKLLRLIADVMEERDRYAAIHETPVTLSMVSVDFAARTLTRDGRTIGLSDDMAVISFPIVTGARIVLPPHDGYLL